MDDIDNLLLDDYDIDETIENNEHEKPNDNNELPKKKQKKQKLDVDLLLDPKGLPLLKSEASNLQFRGKGYEDEDLRKLINYYTVWANNLYPKFRFQDFVQKVTKPANSKLIKARIEDWRNEYVERRNIRMNIRRELSENTVNEESQVQDEESSEDDNRPLFFPITNTTPKIQKSKQKSKAPAITTNQNDSDSEEDEPLFNRGAKRKIVLDDEDDETESSTNTMTRKDALALIAQKKAERENAKKAEEEKKRQEDITRREAALERTTQDIMEEYDQENIELALSDNELLNLNMENITSSPKSVDMDESMGFSDNELIELSNTDLEQSEKLTEF